MKNERLKTLTKRLLLRTSISCVTLSIVYILAFSKTYDYRIWFYKFYLVTIFATALLSPWFVREEAGESIRTVTKLGHRILLRIFFAILDIVFIANIAFTGMGVCEIIKSATG